MMKNFLWMLCMALFISCGNNENANKDDAATTQPGKVYTAVQLNERIIALESSLEEPMLKAEAEIKVRGDKGNMGGVAQSAKALEDSIQVRIDEVKNLAPVGVGGEDYKIVAIRYFEHLKSIYTAYKEIAGATNDNTRQQKVQQMQSIISAQPAIMANLQQAQQKYAADNGFVY